MIFESIGMEASYETSPIPCKVAPQAAESIISGFQRLRKLHMDKFSRLTGHLYSISMISLKSLSAVRIEELSFLPLDLQRISITE